MGKFFQKIYNKLPLVLILLAAWIVLAGDYHPAVMGVGMSVVLIAVWVLPDDAADMLSPAVVKRIFLLFGFLLFAFAEIFIASYKLAYYTFHPGIKLHSSIFSYDYGLRSRLGILLLSTIITLTPGTLVLDVAGGQNRFYIHTLSPSAEGKEEILHPIRGIEKRLRRICE